MIAKSTAIRTNKGRRIIPKRDDIENHGEALNLAKPSQSNEDLRHS